ncbi:hypothetical protein BASA81_010069 [Batrachochytrium salamandrivorans]|nr:hypothetical protein BASA81_010069 [Batrachochytrium salamandrivorans]
MDFDEYNDYGNDGADGAGEAEEGGGAFEFASVDEDMYALESRLKMAKDGLVFVVDCRRDVMFAETKTGKTPWQVALIIISRVLRRKVIVQAKTQCSLVFWGTREQSNDNAFDHVYEFMQFDLPSAGKISQLDAFLTDKGRQLFETKVGSGGGLASNNQTLEQALWLTLSHFTSQKYTSRDEQRVWIFTRDPDLGPEGKERVAMRLDDLHKTGAAVTLWTMTANRKEFDLTRYWNEVLGRKSLLVDNGVEGEEGDGDEEDGVVWVEEEANLAQVLDLTRRREFAKCTLVSLPLVLGPNVEIGVKMYAIVLETKLPNAVALEERTGKPIKISTKWLCPTTAQHVSADQILTTARYGPHGAIAMSAEEKKRLKRFAPASLTILGFKPLSELKVWQNVRAPYLIRADGKSVKNSHRALMCLVGEVLAQDKFAVARLISNRSAAPKLVALLPQAEILDQDGDVVSPLGFLVVVLPFADDVREPTFPHGDGGEEDGENEQGAEHATPDQVDKAKLLITKLCNTKPFDPREYENPALQKFWHNLEALALDQRAGEDGAGGWNEGENDLLCLPNEDELVFDEDFVKTAEDFVESFGGPGELTATTKRKPAVRRAAADGDEEDKPKRVRSGAADDGAVYDEYNWPQLVDSDGISRLKNDELKIYLAHHGLTKTGTKAVMIDRIRQHMES